MTALREGQRQSSPPQAPQITALQAGFLREPEVQLVRGGTAFSLLEFGLLPSRGKHPAQTRFPQAASLRPLVNSPKGLLVWPGFQLARGGTAISLLEFGLLPGPGKPPAKTRFPQAASLRPLVNSPEGPREIASNRADNRIGKLLAAMKAGILLFPARQRVGQQVEHFLLVELVEEAGGHERCG